MALCSMFDIHVFCENPTGSQFFRTPEFLVARDFAGLASYQIYLGAFGQTSLKPITVFMSHNEETIQGLLISRKLARERVRELGSPMKLAPLTRRIKTRSKKTTGWNAKGWVTGAKRNLRRSQAYPREFAVVLASAIMLNVRQHTDP